MRLRVAICLLLFLVVPPIPGQAPNQPANESKNPQGSARTQAQPAQQVKPAPIVNPVISPGSRGGGTEKKESNEPVSISTVKPLDVRADVVKDWMDRLNWVLAAVLVLIGAFGVSYARKTLKAIEGQLVEIRAAGKQTDKMIEHAGTQADAAKLSAEAATLAANTAKSALEIAERADVLVSKVEVSTPLIYQHTKITVWIKNYGRTRAERITAKCRCPIHPEAPEQMFNARVPNLLGAGESADIPFVPVRPWLTPEISEKINEGKSLLFFYAEINYIDVFGAEHHTHAHGPFMPQHGKFLVIHGMEQTASKSQDQKAT